MPKQIITRWISDAKRHNRPPEVIKQLIIIQDMIFNDLLYTRSQKIKSTATNYLNKIEQKAEGIYLDDVKKLKKYLDNQSDVV